MEIAFNELWILFLQCTIVSILLLTLFRLRSIFGLSLLYTTIGVFQFIQVFLTSKLNVEIVSGIFISSGSMAMFTGSLFTILLIYIREDALEARKIIYALLIANLVLALLLFIFSWSYTGYNTNHIDYFRKEFFIKSARILFYGTIFLLLDAFALIFVYEFISKYISQLFFRMLLTMILILSIDTLLFTISIFYGTAVFNSILISGFISKSIGTVIYSSIFTLYLLYFDKKNAVIESKSDTYKDIFYRLTFRQKYEDIFSEMQRKNIELKESQKIAQLGTYNLNLKSQMFTSSTIFDAITGFNKQEIKSFDNWHSKVHPDDLQGNIKMLDSCIQTGKRFDREFRILMHNTGEVKWIHGIGKIIYKEDEPFYFRGTIQDITARRREEKIKEIIFNITKKANEGLTLDKFFYFIKNELGKLINTTNFFIALYNEKTGMISTAYMVDELDDGKEFPKGKTLTGYLIDSKKALLTKEMVIINNRNEKEIIGLGPESKCWLGVPILIDDEAIGAIVVQSYTDEDAYSEDDVALLELIASNIGQIIKKTENLEKINLLNEALIQTPAIIMLTDKEAKLEYVNPSFTAITGYESHEVLGKNPKFLNSEIIISDFYTKVNDAISKKGFWKDEIINIKKDGGQITALISIAPVVDRHGSISNYVIVGEDITEKRILERQFINAFLEAQEVEKHTFGEELHDGISQILSAEAMYIDLLIEQNQDRMQHKAKFLSKLKELNINAINETRSIAHGLMSSQLKQSGLLNSVENICIDFSLSKNITFNFSNHGVKEEELSKEIKINLFRVVQELTTNINRYSRARKASMQLSKINKNDLRLIIKDNGIGMDYHKIRKELKVTGLQNVERRIKFLNGTINVVSSQNKGTKWDIVVPL